MSGEGQPSELTAHGAIDGATAAEERAKRLFAAVRLKSWGRLRAVPGVCPLCGQPAVVMDWWPQAPWIVVEECPCEGFFVWTELVERRLSRLSPECRQLAVLVREFRTRGHEVWLTTTDGTLDGPLVIRTARPYNV
jgi:hypothetical protein